MTAASQTADCGCRRGEETRRGMKVARLVTRRGAGAVDSRLLLAILALVWQSKAF